MSAGGSLYGGPLALARAGRPSAARRCRCRRRAAAPRAGWPRSPSARPRFGRAGGVGGAAVGRVDVDDDALAVAQVGGAVLAERVADEIGHAAGLPAPRGPARRFDCSSASSPRGSVAEAASRAPRPPAEEAAHAVGHRPHRGAGEHEEPVAGQQHQHRHRDPAGEALRERRGGHVPERAAAVEPAGRVVGTAGEQVHDAEPTEGEQQGPDRDPRAGLGVRRRRHQHDADDGEQHGQHGGAQARRRSPTAAESHCPIGPPAPHQIPAALTTASTSRSTPSPSRRWSGSISRTRPTARPVALPAFAMPRPTPSIDLSSRSGPCRAAGRRAGARRPDAGLRVVEVRVVRPPVPLPPVPRFDVARVAIAPRYPGPVIDTGTETPLPR